jgi:hypothetical protein
MAAAARSGDATERPEESYRGATEPGHALTSRASVHDCGHSHIEARSALRPRPGWARDAPEHSQNRGDPSSHGGWTMASPRSSARRSRSPRRTGDSFWTSDLDSLENEDLRGAGHLLASAVYSQCATAMETHIEDAARRRRVGAAEHGRDMSTGAAEHGDDMPARRAPLKSFTGHLHSALGAYRSLLHNATRDSRHTEAIGINLRGQVDRLYEAAARSGAAEAQRGKVKRDVQAMLENCMKEFCYVRVQEQALALADWAQECKNRESESVRQAMQELKQGHRTRYTCKPKAKAAIGAPPG